MDRPGRARDAAATEPPRLWTVAEANARLPSLEELLPRLKGWVVRLGQVHAELKRLSEFWGPDLDSVDHADHELKTRLDTEWHHLTQRIEEAVGALRTEGILVKELESGLVDFYGIQGGEVVFLCWQRGESAVSYYHPLSGGFRNRKPIVESEPAPPARARGAG